MKKRRRLKKSFAIIFCALILGSTIFASATFCFDAVNANEEIRIEKYDVLSYNSKASDDVVYLSDIPYMKRRGICGNQQVCDLRVRVYFCTVVWQLVKEVVA